MLQQNNFKVFMFNNDLIIKQDEKQFIKLKNFQMDSFTLNQNLEPNITYIHSTPERIINDIIQQTFIDFEFRGKTLELEHIDNNFDYREELIKEIYNDLQNDKN